MVYAIEENLVCVFVAMVVWALPFILFAAMLLAGGALRLTYRALHVAGGVVSRLVVDCCADSPEGNGKALTGDVRSPVLSANVSVLGVERAKS